MSIEKELSTALYEVPKIVQIIGRIANDYEKMNEEQKAKVFWEGTKALIAGAVKYDTKKSIPPIYSMFLENAPWDATIDWFAGMLKKYGENMTTKEVIGKAVDEFTKEGGKNQPTA
jgi:hypothetical protein